MNMKRTIPKKNSRSGSITENLKNFVVEENHPCIMAQTVFKQNNFEIYNYEKMGSSDAANQMLRDIESYVKNYNFESKSFRTFIACFPGDDFSSEKEFEENLWNHLKLMANQDEIPWDDSVSGKADDSKFSFSLGGRAFYIVGMHPNSSRKARRSPFPVLVMNLHWQFELLREMGVYEQVRDRIRKRDKKLQGSINPMVEDFGTYSEARQYSGRNVPADWKCPFNFN